MALTTIEELAAETSTKIEKKFRTALWIMSALAVVALICCVFTAFRSANELSPPESVVAAQSLMLAHDGTLYYGLNSYPYTVCAYMPIFYILEAGLVHAHLTAFQGGRMVSVAAWCGLVLLAWKLVLLYTPSRNAAWVAAILVASSSLLLFWGSVGQVDTLAVFFAAAAFFQFSKYHVRGDATLLSAGVFAALALFTKQTMVSAAAAIFLALWLRDKRRAMWFAISLGVTLGAAILIVNKALHGNFLADTVFANMNPMSGKKFLSQLQFFGSVSGCLTLVAAAGIGRMIRSRSLPVVIYLGVAATVFLLTAAKLGSDTNYQIELTVVLAVASAIAVHELNFFPLLFQGSKKWVTLLLLPLAVHAAVGYRATANTTIFRWAIENQWRESIDQLRPYVAASGGRVLCTDFNAMVRLRERLDIEPFIYGLLVAAHVVDPEPVRRDLAQGAFATVILGDNVFEAKGPSDPELGGLPEIQLAQIRTHYRLLKHIDGPFANGTYVYVPNKGGGQ
jgi:hypothetical protein